ncbi:hypothetical protein C7M84_007142 [Penaeus vannamei]|uniref:Uncharacterized protein n=1 Tax=Penaeus vannamei TaxID=6689 RepID=A0A3R7MEL8_PENVA|nr:hypothetical protein C7M84_007142 [Penaeus vannamei]
MRSCLSHRAHRGGGGVPRGRKALRAKWPCWRAKWPSRRTKWPSRRAKVPSLRAKWPNPRRSGQGGQRCLAEAKVAKPQNEVAKPQNEVAKPRTKETVDAEMRNGVRISPRTLQHFLRQPVAAADKPNYPGLAWLRWGLRLDRSRARSPAPFPAPFLVLLSLLSGFSGLTRRALRGAARPSFLLGRRLVFRRDTFPIPLTSLCSRPLLVLQVFAGIAIVAAIIFIIALSYPLPSSSPAPSFLLLFPRFPSSYVFSRPFPPPPPLPSLPSASPALRSPYSSSPLLFFLFLLSPSPFVFSCPFPPPTPPLPSLSPLPSSSSACSLLLLFPLFPSSFAPPTPPPASPSLLDGAGIVLLILLLSVTTQEFWLLFPLCRETGRRGGVRGGGMSELGHPAPQQGGRLSNSTMRAPSFPRINGPELFLRNFSFAGLHFVALPMTSELPGSATVLRAGLRPAPAPCPLGSCERCLPRRLGRRWKDRLIRW